MYAMSVDDADESGVSKYENMSLDDLKRDYNNSKELQRYIDGAKKKAAAMMTDGSGDLQELNFLIKLTEEHIIYLARKNAEPGKDEHHIGRVASIEFDIKTSEMLYTLDLEKFQERVELLFKWHVDMKTQDQYMAPYFPLVQSSGMGKTKLLYELKKYTIHSRWS